MIDRADLRQVLIVLIVMIASIFGGIVVALLASCSHSPVAEHTVVVPQVLRCAQELPPTYVSVPEPAFCKKGQLCKDCVPGRFCYSKADEINLEEDVEKLKGWVNRLWTLCGVAGAVVGGGGQ